MKKYIFQTLAIPSAALILSLSFAGCGGDDKKEKTVNDYCGQHPGLCESVKKEYQAAAAPMTSPPPPSDSETATGTGTGTGTGTTTTTTTTTNTAPRE